MNSAFQFGHCRLLKGGFALWTELASALHALPIAASRDVDLVRHSRSVSRNTANLEVPGEANIRPFPKRCTGTVQENKKPAYKRQQYWAYCFFAMTSYSLVAVYRRFGRTYYLYFLDPLVLACYFLLKA
jgi:hypothetical protein